MQVILDVHDIYACIFHLCVYRVITGVIFGAQGAAQASSFGIDYSKAKAAAGRLFALFDLEPAIDSSSEHGIKLVGGWRLKPKIDISVTANTGSEIMFEEALRFTSKTITINITHNPKYCLKHPAKVLKYF